VKGILRGRRCSARSVAHSPGFTITAVLVLALGIGACATIFSLLDAEVFRALPSENADRLVLVYSGKELLLNWRGVLVADLEDWERRSRAFEETALFLPDSVNLSGGGDPERVEAPRVSVEGKEVQAALLQCPPTVSRPQELEPGVWCLRSPSPPSTGRLG
jgi:putative ABC transport system permease protein